jgi:hypothetical protein
MISLFGLHFAMVANNAGVGVEKSWPMCGMVLKAVMLLATVLCFARSETHVPWAVFSIVWRPDGLCGIDDYWNGSGFVQLALRSVGFTLGCTPKWQMQGLGLWEH